LAIKGIADIEKIYFETTALLNVVKLAVEQIEQESLQETGICETIDLVQEKRTEIYEYFSNTMKPKLSKVI
jgi:hypothetical protein